MHCQTLALGWIKGSGLRGAMECPNAPCCIGFRTWRCSAGVRRLCARKRKTGPDTLNPFLTVILCRGVRDRCIGTPAWGAGGCLAFGKLLRTRDCAGSHPPPQSPSMGPHQRLAALAARSLKSTTKASVAQRPETDQRGVVVEGQSAA